MHTSLLPAPTFPARPVNGGPLDKAQPKHGEWLYEPKFNGWRTLIHVPTGIMFNRHGRRLSIESEFTKALAFLKAELWRNVDKDHDLLTKFIGRPRLTPDEVSWADCEGLERRHDRGRGSLVLLDLPFLRLPLKQRGYAMRYSFCPAITHCATNNMVYSIPQYTDGPAHYRECKEFNKDLGCTFYEGVVAKRADSLYPIQLRSADQEFPFWMKHRWQF